MKTVKRGWYYGFFNFYFVDIFNEFFIHFYLKGDSGQSFTPVFMSYFCWLYWESALHKVLWQFDQISQSYKVTKFCNQRMWRHTHECIKHVTTSFLCIFCYFHGENTDNKVLRWFLPFFMNLRSSKVLND